MEDTEENSDYSTSNLEHCSYRHLQQLAKSMDLPSNVKKIYLIEMINAKKCSSESEVARIVQRVKMQRQLLSKRRYKRTYMKRFNSDSDSASPPITITPKRPVVIRCNPEHGQVFMQSQNSLLHPTVPKPASDRVLRSCNIRPAKRYMDEMVETDRDRETQMRVVRKYKPNIMKEMVGSNHDRVDDVQMQVVRKYTPSVLNEMVVGTDCQRVEQSTQMRVFKKYKPNILSNSHMSRDRQLVPVSQMPPRQIIVKRPRLLSGIYPLNKEQNFQVQSVGVRNSEGKLSKINAIVHKPSTKDKSNHTVFDRKIKRTIEVTLQDIMNGNLDAQAGLQSLNYPNTSAVTESESYPEVSQDFSSVSSVYYHKKIRAEQVRDRRLSSLTVRSELPKINEAFSQFRDTRDVTQPLYVQVSEEAERMQNYPLYSKRSTCLLETMYNFKSQFLTNQPLLMVATTTNTKCVYSTPTVSTAVPHKSATVTCLEPYAASYEPVNHYPYNMDSSRMNDCFRSCEQDYDFRCNEEQKTSSSMSTAQSQELGANVTISDMVEDALELISQDGDYMERMGMDVRMQCVLCNWAGAKIILEYHIRKEHSDVIEKQDKLDWYVSVSLASIVRQPLWSSRVIEHAHMLYVLSVKHEQPHCFMATLSHLSSDPDITTASITVLNKFTGEPHTWYGEIHELSSDLPYGNNPGLKLDLSKLSLREFDTVFISITIHQSI